MRLKRKPWPLCKSQLINHFLLNHLALQRNESLIVDMEAGTEHLGRATCEASSLATVPRCGTDSNSVFEPGATAIALS